MVYHLQEENIRLKKLVRQLKLELEEERNRNSTNIDLLMKSESLRERIILDAILGKYSIQ